MYLNVGRICEGSELLANVLNRSASECDIGDDDDIRLQSGLQSMYPGRDECRPKSNRAKQQKKCRTILLILLYFTCMWHVQKKTNKKKQTKKRRLTNNENFKILFFQIFKNGLYICLHFDVCPNPIL